MRWLRWLRSWRLWGPLLTMVLCVVLAIVLRCSWLGLLWAFCAGLMLGLAVLNALLCPGE